MKTVTAGPALVELIALCYQAGMPLMLVGKHGVGKSQILAQAAKYLQIGLIVRDLSLMEPIDLIGLPRIGPDHRTHHVPPAFLPEGGKGFLLFEELNRAPRYMQGPCLELLTSRRLNDYLLPESWVPCAAINDGEEGEYLVEALDPALLSRFVRVGVAPGVEEWVAWASTDGNGHEKVVEFVECHPGVFDDPEANPRAWSFASRLLRAWEIHGDGAVPLLETALAGVVGEKWAAAFLQYWRSGERPLRPEEVVGDYPNHRPVVRKWVADGRVDLVRATVERLKRHLRELGSREADRAPGIRENLERFLSDLPAELKTQVKAWLEENRAVALGAAL